MNNYIKFVVIILLIFFTGCSGNSEEIENRQFVTPENTEATKAPELTKKPKNTETTKAPKITKSDNTKQIRKKPIKIEAGYEHVLVLNEDGTVESWGSDYDGQCDAGKSNQTKVPEGLSNVISIAAGGFHSVALKEDGTIVCWGSNTDFYRRESNQCNPPEGIKAKAISAGMYHTVALTYDDTVVCWGSNTHPIDSSKLLDKDYEDIKYSCGQAMVPDKLNNIESIIGLDYSTVAIRSDGKTCVWGDKKDLIEKLENIKDIDSGMDFFVYMTQKGELKVIGDNVYKVAQIPSNVKNVKSISAGSVHISVINQDGTVTSWGDNGCGKCNVPAGLKAKDIASGGDFTVAISEDDTIVGWGRNSVGALDIPDIYKSQGNNVESN